MYKKYDRYKIIDSDSERYKQFFTGKIRFINFRSVLLLRMKFWESRN